MEALGNSQFIPLSVPNLKGNEKVYACKAIESEWVSTAGPYVKDFEKQIAQYVNASGAVSCQSGTAGLHTALLVCGVTSSDVVLVPTLTFIAAVNPVRYVGAQPIFLDCDDSLCIDPEKLAQFCKEECIQEGDGLHHRATKKRVAAIVVVHVFGNLANMDKIMQIADEYSIDVVEDATEALGSYYVGGTYSGKYAGTIGKIGVYSFNGNKLITTGGGGMIVSGDEDLLRRSKHLTTQAKADELNFVHDEVGYNYRLTNLQAALGIAQLEQIEQFIAHKRANYQRYYDSLNGRKGLKVLEFRSDIRPNYWFYSLYLGKQYPLDRDRLIQNLHNAKIQTRPIWGLIHEQLPYKSEIAYLIENAIDYHRHVVNIPCSSNLSPEDVERVISTVLSFAD